MSLLLDDDGNARGPAEASDRAVLAADDVGNVVWPVTPIATATVAAPAPPVTPAADCGTPR